MSSSRTYLDKFAQQAAASLSVSRADVMPRVLDAGAGTAPYRRAFEALAEYETADHIASGEHPLTYEGDLAAIPVEAGRYDLVFCSQVLEHVPEPARVVAEMARVLKPGGSIWLSTPLFYPEHEAPYDFFRYTQYGLRKLMEDAGLVVGRVEWLEGYLGTLGFQLRFAAEHLPARPHRYGGGMKGLVVACSVIALRPVFRLVGRVLDGLDERHRLVDVGMPKNYTVVAHKPEQ